MSVAWVGVGTALVGGVMASSASRKASDAASASATEAANAQERIATAELDFAKEQYGDNKVRFDKADRLTEQVTNKQLASMDQNMELAADYDNYNKTTYRPLEQRIVADAAAYDTPERQEAEAGKASASVKQNMAAATAANGRAQARMGVNPNSGRAIVTQNETAITGALAEAGAENNARKAVETLGAAKRMDAASLGRNLPSAQATSAGLGINAGNSAVANTATTNASITNGAAGLGSLYSNAAGTFGGAAKNFTNIANSANSAAESEARGIGSLVNGVTNSLSKVNWSGIGTGTYDSWAAGNAGVSASTDLSINQLATAF